MKQEDLAAELGISQQAVSKIEQSPEVEDEALNKIASALGITSEAIKTLLKNVFLIISIHLTITVAQELGVLSDYFFNFCFVVNKRITDEPVVSHTDMDNLF